MDAWMPDSEFYLVAVTPQLYNVKKTDPLCNFICDYLNKQEKTKH